MRLRLLISVVLMAAAASPLTPARAEGPSLPDGEAVVGYDVSHPQCGSPLPSNPAFAVVGVNGGRVFSVNPCLGDQLAWAHSADRPPAYYANTANPGPLLSSHWPSGQSYPRACASEYPANNSEDCSYDYGWAAAEDSFTNAYYAALATYGAGADKPDGDWWLDVETTNTWQTLTADVTGAEQARANASAALQGAVDYLTTEAGVRQVGFYSSPKQWKQITGGTGDRFAAHPVWLAGAGDRAEAVQRCDPSQSFTGGEVQLVQYPSGGFDANVRCRGT